MTRRRGLLYHFTHISNLASIAAEGLFSDAQIETSRKAPDGGRTCRCQAATTEPCGTSGAWRLRCRLRPPSTSPPDPPMLFIISKGDVPTYSGDQDEIVYLVTSTEKIVEERLHFVFTDRNAALHIADYGNDLQDLDDYVDWDLMEGRMWKNTDEEPRSPGAADG